MKKTCLQYIPESVTLMQELHQPPILLNKPVPRELPIELINTLISLGYYFEENDGSYYYSNPTGEPVPDAFKGQTMMAIRKVNPSVPTLIYKKTIHYFPKDDRKFNAITHRGSIVIY